MNHISAIVTAVSVVFSQAQVPDDLQTKLEAALKSGQIAWELSTPEDVEKILGNPTNKRSSTEGGRETVVCFYDKLQVAFMKQDGNIFRLFAYRLSNGQTVRKPPSAEAELLIEKVKQAINSGKIVWKFSEPEEIVELIGKPLREETRPDGGMEVMFYYYDFDFRVVFTRMQDGLWMDGGSFGLAGYGTLGAEVRSPDGAIKLREASDLNKIDTFWGLSGMDASMVDLTKEEARLRELPFDTLTKWPGSEKLPKGFNPHEILESGKNPGLGLRALHAKGIDGYGVDIAIVDQPLIPNHAENESRFHLIAELGVEGVRPQMHGPAVTSIAVGKTCGVAPKAELYYVSEASWTGAQIGNRNYIDALEKILELNKNKSTNIRVVSISTGVFETYAQFDVWQTLLERAEKEGLLVITCDQDATKLQYALLRPLPGNDRDKPESYTAGTISRDRGELLVPGDGRTYASHLGKDVYSYSPIGGASWAAPWLAGLAALGYQVNPTLKPADIRKYLKESATAMPYGNVANPAKFIEMCKGE